MVGGCLYFAGQPSQIGVERPVMSGNRGLLLVGSLVLGDRQGRGDSVGQLWPGQWARTISYAQAELAQQMLSVRVLLRDRDRDDAPAVVADLFFRLKDCFVVFAKVRRNGPAGLIIAVDGARGWIVVLTEIGRCVFERHRLRL